MAKITKEDIISSLKDMTLLEINDLIKDIEKEFNAKADAINVVQTSNSQNKEEEKISEVSITLKSVGTQKVAVIKAIQYIIGLGLMDSKKIVDNASSLIKEKISLSEAEDYKKILVSVGAEVEIK